MKLEVKLINPILKSLHNMFKTMIGVDVVPEKPIIKKDHIGKGLYTGIITLTGRRANISIAISFPEDTIKEITQDMMPPGTVPTLGVMADLTGELANMISGGAKGIYEAHGYKLDISLPILIIGREHIIMHKVKGTRILIPYSCDIGDFWVEAVFHE